MKMFKLSIPAHKKNLPKQANVDAVVECKFQKDCAEAARVELTRQGFNPDHFKNPKIETATQEEFDAYQASFDSGETVISEDAAIVPQEVLDHKKYNRVLEQHLEDSGQKKPDGSIVYNYAMAHIYKVDGHFTVAHGYHDIYNTNSGRHLTKFTTYSEAATFVIGVLIDIADKSHKIAGEPCFAVRAKLHFQGFLKVHEFVNQDFIDANIKLAKDLNVEYSPASQLDIVEYIADKEAVETESPTEESAEKPQHENTFSEAEAEITANFPAPQAILPDEDYEPEESEIQDIRGGQAKFIGAVMSDIKTNIVKYENYYTNGFAALSDIDCAIDSKEVALNSLLSKWSRVIAIDKALIVFAENFTEEPKQALVMGDTSSKLAAMTDKVDQNLETPALEAEEEVSIDLDTEVVIEEKTTTESIAVIEDIDLETGEVSFSEESVELEESIDIDIEAEFEEVKPEAETVVVEYKPSSRIKPNETASNSLIDNLLPIAKEKPKRVVPKFEEGVYEGVIDDDYHADDSESSTNIKEALVSGMYYKNKKDGTIPRVEKQVFSIGKLIHAMCLEPDTVKDRFIVEPSEPRKPTKPQKEAYEKGSATDKAIKSVEFWANFEKVKEEKGLTCCNADNWKLAESMRKAVYSNPHCSKLLSHSLGKREVSYFKVDKETGLMMKVRPDLSVSNICCDVKSVELWGHPDSDNIQAALRKEIVKRGYHISAAMYNEIGEFEQFAWIFINKTEGYHWSAVVVASEEMLELGKLKYDQGKRVIADGKNKGIYDAPIIEPFTAELSKYDRAELDRLRAEL